MDEYLFISMAKLGADRVRKERLDRAASPSADARRASPSLNVWTRSAARASQPSAAAARLATYSLAFAFGLAALGVGGGIAAALEDVPNGQVIVTELDSGSSVPDEVKVALNEAGSRHAR